jgi:predicted Zn-dependent protease
MPPELEKDSVIHAYLVKDGHFNAAMTPFGIMYVNVGLLVELPSEASLASVFTHELAHYYLRHSLKRFIKEENKDLKGYSSKIIAVSSPSIMNSRPIRWGWFG